MDLIGRIVNAVPRPVLETVERQAREGIASFEASFSEDRLFEAPSTVLNSAMTAIEGVAAGLSAVTEVLLPQELRQDVANAIERDGPRHLAALQAKMIGLCSRLDLDPGELKYYPYLRAAERAVPYSTVYAVARTLRRNAGSLTALANLIGHLKPPKLEAAALEEKRSRAMIHWASGSTVSVFYPFAVDALVTLEAIQRGSKIHKQRDGAAVNAFNNSIEKAKVDAPALSDEFSFARNAVFHGRYEVRPDGSVVLNSDDVSQTLSAAQASALGAEVVRSCMGVAASFGIVAAARLIDDFAESNIIEVLGASVRGTAVPEFDTTTPRDESTLIEQLRKCDLPELEDDTEDEEVT